MLFPTLSIYRKPYPSLMFNCEYNFESSLKCQQAELTVFSSTCSQHVTTISLCFISFCSTLMGVVQISILLPPRPCNLCEYLEKDSDSFLLSGICQSMLCSPPGFSLFFRAFLGKQNMNMNCIFSSTFLLPVGSTSQACSVKKLRYLPLTLELT